MYLLECNPGICFPIEVLMLPDEPFFDVSLEKMLSSILPNTEIVSPRVSSWLSYQTELKTKVIHTFQVHVDSDIDFSTSSSIQNLSIYGTYRSGHNPNVVLPNCNYRCLHVKNNEQIRFKSESGERIKVKSLILEGKYNTLSTLIDGSSVELLHILVDKFGYDLTRFPNLHNLSVDNMDESKDFIFKGNVLKFLRFRTGSKEFTSSVNSVLSCNFVKAHLESLEQIVCGWFYSVFWYEISVFSNGFFQDGREYIFGRHRFNTKLTLKNVSNFPKLVHLTVHNWNYYLARLNGIHYKTFVKDTSDQIY
jgi:hypothetical protein